MKLLEVAGLAGHAEPWNRHERISSSLVSKAISPEIPPCYMRLLEVAGLAGQY